MINVTVNQENLEYFLLILVRITSFMSTAPFFSQSNTPVRTRLGLSIFISYLIFVLVPLQEATLNYDTVIGYAELVLKESVVGLLLGFAAFICSTIIQFSGKMMDMEIGMSMAQMFDPTTKTQSGLTGTIYTNFVFLLLMVSNMHLYLLETAVDSFQLIPIGGAVIGDSMFDTVVGFLSTYFIVGFRIILPVFGTILVVNCSLGVMAKVAPQMNMFAVGMQIKLITGIVVMYITVQTIPSIANFIFQQMQQMVNGMLEGLIG